MNNRLEQQMKFIMEMDKLKSIFRQSYISGTERRENDAEHSWHLAMLALVLSEHSDASLNILTVLKMVLIHDIVEIDAGDVFCYDHAAIEGKYAREKSAANRIFALLSDDQKTEMIGLWQEFEQEQTTEARFAKALDRLMPLLHNYYSEGKTWKEHGVQPHQVIDRIQHIKAASTELWKFANSIIDQSISKGYFTK